MSQPRVARRFGSNAPSTPPMQPATPPPESPGFVARATRLGWRLVAWSRSPTPHTPANRVLGVAFLFLLVIVLLTVVLPFAALLTLGDAASEIAEQHGAPLLTLAALERRMWAPEECPLCKRY